MTTDTNTEKPDYVIAREELKALYDNKLPQAMIIGGELRVKDGWKHRYYEVKIGDASFTWMQGTGIKGKPDQAEVLARSCADYLSAKEQTFDEWCGEFDYDSDSIKAKGIYDECQAIGNQLNKLQALRHNRALITQFAELANRL